MRTIIKRPSRFQLNKAGYELTLSGLVMGRAIVAVQDAETELNDAAGDLQEGALFSPDSWDVMQSRYERARKKLHQCRTKMAEGQTCANRSLSIHHCN